MAPSLVSPMVVLLLALSSVSAEFACNLTSSILDCVCSNTDFTTQLCSDLKTANTTAPSSSSSSSSSADFTGIFRQISDPAAALTLFAVNDSAFEGLTSAEQTAYDSNIVLGMKYLIVNQTLSLDDLQKKDNWALTTLAGSDQLLIVTTSDAVSSSSSVSSASKPNEADKALMKMALSATNSSATTVLNDDDSCVVQLCSPAGKGSVCLVGCVLAPTDGLGTIAIIGIAVAGVAAACLVVACLFNIFRKDSNDDDDDEDDDADDDEGSYHPPQSGGE